ncbi:MAG: aminotransferase class I/II-fold pyridoxal phosphate-dependent enzyme [Clostridia bacterium]|nr:aminotransferase class I/II-fold pyridoxal phosphate-dependent enzyme [Clostridia bacterium]
MAVFSNQHRAPVLEALKAYVEDRVIRFHMPGHKGGLGADPEMRKFLGSAVYAADVTGVEGMDDLHAPLGVLREAEELAAQLFGADRSFFLINGTSSGVQGMILGTIPPGDKLIVSRNVHKSILAGIVLAGIEPIYLQPDIDSYLGIAMGFDPEKVWAKAQDQSGVCGALVVNPTYYGVACQLEQLSANLHAQDQVLLVDEAHGPHFHFHPQFPAPALEQGADACAQGMHKLLSSLTQASMLHLKGNRVNAEAVAESLRLIQSTSASYLLLASLDAARRQMFLQGYELWSQALSLASTLREALSDIPGIYVFGPEILDRGGSESLDLTKVTITVKELGITGQKAEIILRCRFNIQVEMSDLFNVLVMVGIGNTEEEIFRLAEAVRYLAQHCKEFQEPEALQLLAAAEKLDPLPPASPLAMLPREAFFAAKEACPLKQSQGRVAAELVTCYPPGIPILGPGEVISQSAIDYLEVVRRAGLRISGPRDLSLETLQVVK